MSNLSKETIDRIDSEAVKLYPIAASHTITDGPRAGYKKGATEWAGRAQPVVDAVDKLLELLPSGNLLNYYFAKEQVIKAREELAKYKEVSNDKETT